MTAGAAPVLVPPAGSGTWRRDEVLAALRQAGTEPDAAVPVRLGRWDTDPRYARWRSGWGA